VENGARRETGCHADGRRPWNGVCVDPVPRATSIARLDWAKIARAALIRREQQPTVRAIQVLVTSQCRPVALSAWAARTAQMDTKSVSDMW
jgi:hypothetical protein